MIRLFFYIIFLLSIISCSKEGKIANNINEQFHVEIDGALLPVKVRGNTASQKIILFINGGPGGTGLDLSIIDPGNWKYNLEKDFAIAYYDQRGTGNTQGKIDEASISLKQYIDDIYAIISTLKYRYKSCKIYLMGHSFGAMLVYRFINTYGDLNQVEKYVAASGTATRPKFDQEHWDTRIEYLNNIANENITNNLEVDYWNSYLMWISEHPNVETTEERAEFYQYLQRTEIYEEISLKFKDYFNVLLFSDNNFFAYYISILKKQPFINQLVDEERQWDIKSEISSINKPILLIGGEFDIAAPPQELNWIYEEVISSEKDIVIIPDAGHDLFISQPLMFYESIKSFIND
jgi:pimeloyl-ACP methyl ester carboxylesterase